MTYSGKKPASPSLGIVIPCKNEQVNIPRLLESLRRQTFITTSTPIVIADAHSTDGTRAVIADFQARHSLNIRVIDGGLPPVGRNLGASQLNTEYLLFLDADIVLGEPDTLAKVYQEVEKRGLELAVTRIRCENGNAFDHFFWRAYDFMAWAKVLGPVVTGMFVFIRKDAFDRVGGFREDMLLGDDVELGRQISRDKFSIVPTFITNTNRRFVKDGYAKTVLSYIQVFVSRSHRLKPRTDYFPVGAGRQQ